METGASASSVLAPLLAGFVSTVVTKVLVRTRALPLDTPNQRSLHAIPVPRTGGIGIIIGFVVAAWWLHASLALLVPTAVLTIASYLDDRHASPPPIKLAVHLIAAGVFLWPSSAPTGAAMLILLLLAVAWMTNLFNFMDGSDGLAGGMAIIGFSTYGLASWMGGSSELSLLTWSIAAAAAGFLIFNFYPAKIFMGDVGSIPLGFLAGSLGITGWFQDLWPLWFPLVVFAPFIVDTSITLVRRLLRGERVWEAHRKHYYQRLILAGWSHRKAALTEYAFMLMCAAAAMLCLRASPAVQLIVIATLAGAFAVAMRAIDLRWRQFSASAHD
jgi:UDP-N-acetylmuramyl pentapeptide phosphotransferase/UDP-N-acetylglucosamine-1-phosphate transferase